MFSMYLSMRLVHCSAKLFFITFGVKVSETILFFFKFRFMFVSPIINYEQ